MSGSLGRWPVLLSAGLRVQPALQALRSQLRAGQPEPRLSRGVVGSVGPVSSLDSMWLALEEGGLRPCLFFWPQLLHMALGLHFYLLGHVVLTCAFPVLTVVMLFLIGKKK